MHPSLFKALSSASYWPWVSYPMGKRALILKRGTNHSVILVAMAIYTLYRTVPSYYLGCMCKLITLHEIGQPSKFDTFLNIDEEIQNRVAGHGHYHTQAISL